MKTEQLELPLKIVKTQAEIIKECLEKTDWNAFWNDVADAASQEIEAYRQAEARSRARAAEHWLV